MGAPQTTSDLGRKILQELYDLAWLGHGFERHGVRGWASAREIEEGARVSSIAHELRTLTARGLVIREDARVPGQPMPAYVYRITEAAIGTPEGVRERAGGACTFVPPGPEPDEQVYLGPGMRAALRALRHAAEHPLPDPVIPDEPSWRSSRQLTAWLDEEAERIEVRVPRQSAARSSTDRVIIAWRFYRDELAWGIRAGLLERRQEREVLYRITTAGLALRVMEWFEPPEPEELARWRGAPDEE